MYYILYYEWLSLLLRKYLPTLDQRIASYCTTCSKRGVGLAAVRVAGLGSQGPEFESPVGRWMNTRWGCLSLSSFQGRQNEYQRPGNRGIASVAQPRPQPMKLLAALRSTRRRWRTCNMLHNAATPHWNPMSCVDLYRLSPSSWSMRTITLKHLDTKTTAQALCHCCRCRSCTHRGSQ